MKKFTKRFAIFALLVVFAQTFMFAKEMSLLDLNKDILTLKYQIYQLENDLGEYEDMSSFKKFFVKAKAESLLRKRESELKKRAAENSKAAKEAANQALKELEATGKDFKKLGKDIGNAFKDFFN